MLLGASLLGDLARGALLGGALGLARRRLGLASRAGAGASTLSGHCYLFESRVFG